MSQSREEVLQLLAAKRISADEADRLLRVMDQRPGTWAWLFNPLSRLPPGYALAMTAIPVACQLTLERQGVHFDGALDVHTNGVAATWALSILDALVGFPLMTLVLWTATLLAKRTARLLDVAAAVGLSRWPLTISALLVLPISWHGLEAGGHSNPAEILRSMTPGDYALIAASLPLVVWSVVWVITGFRTASGERGARLTRSMVGGLVVAEVLSKLILHLAL